MQQILQEIVRNKRKEIQERKAHFPLERLQACLSALGPARDFYSAIKGGGDNPTQGKSVRLIAEIKKASPSRGVLREDFDPLRLACWYEGGGAAALSVLTDEKYFQGRLEFLSLVKIHSPLPVLQKDFILDAYQIYEARRWGADAILLIAAILEEGEMENLYRTAEGTGLSVIVEVHDEADLERALALRPRIIGINNRDLRTFRVSLDTTVRLAESIPRDIVKVSESGLFRREDVLKVRAVGVDAILVGEALMSSREVTQTVKDLTGMP